MGGNLGTGRLGYGVKAQDRSAEYFLLTYNLVHSQCSRILASLDTFGARFLSIRCNQPVFQYRRRGNRSPEDMELNSPFSNNLGLPKAIGFSSFILCSRPSKYVTVNKSPNSILGG